ncbi:conserved oligomeric Golgi complex subunit 2 [Prorops nasuta]|uniref:conserved oligomeric Golgi complex subunit 2 n=1 Tax=Prorops nasuta TaxID=863751 RepID=UPI0034CE15BB
MTENSITLPKAPKDLCFTEHDFIEDNFDVDTFLQNHRKNVKLEAMRDDLGIYLKLLRSAMIDLINRDYSDFVDLSSNLIGLDKAINDLEIPLGQLKEEVMQVRQVLDDEIQAVTKNLKSSQQIREKKQSLHSLAHVYELLRKLFHILSIEISGEKRLIIDVLEQAVVEYNELNFHMCRCKSYLTREQEEESNKLENLLISHLNELFLTSLNNKDTALLTRCLRIYVILDRISIAENLIAKRIIGPLVDDIINEENLQNGLHNIYQQLLNIISLEMKQLLDITLYADRASINSFNFLVNSFWTEVEDKIERNIKSIFGPGNPELFHNRYKETLEFLITLEATCRTPESLNALRNNSQYKHFLKKWNLPVYFQIRFQELAGTVEASLMESVSNITLKVTFDSLQSENFSLSPTHTTWNCLIKVWSDDIYLQQLFQKFWKLCLQISSRYHTWVLTTLATVWPSSPETYNLSDIQSNSKLKLLVYLNSDVEKLIHKLSTFVQLVISKTGQEVKSSVYKLLEDSLRGTLQNLEATLPLITNEVVKELLKPCSSHLKQVSDIPRLFRRTKREVPTKPCAYVKNSLNFLFAFHKEYIKIIPTKVNQWLELALESLTDNYLTSVMDLITSVQKTEESLKRLKKIRDKTTGVFPPEAQGVSDEEKIRIQLQVDVYAYTDMVKEIGVSTEKIRQLQELRDTVEAAGKK